MTAYTLHLGDCLEYMRTLPDGAFDAVVTDPPYGIGYASSWKTRMGGGDRRTRPDFGEDIYLPGWLPEIARVLKEPGLAYVFVRWDVAHIFKRDGEAAGLVCVQRLVWDKRHWGMGDLRYYGSQTEDALLFRKGAPALNAAQRRGNLWAYPSKAYFPEGCYDHPAQKPVGLLSEWIEDATSPGDTIFDPFMGSGTTGVACMQLGRNFVGCEIDPDYFAIAERRISEAARQPPLFITDPQPKPKQKGLLE